MLSFRLIIRVMCRSSNNSEKVAKILMTVACIVSLPFWSDICNDTQKRTSTYIAVRMKERDRERRMDRCQ